MSCYYVTLSCYYVTMSLKDTMSKNKKGVPLHHESITNLIHYKTIYKP